MPNNTLTITDNRTGQSYEVPVTDADGRGFRAEQAGSQLREEKFKKLLEVAKSEPVEKPLKDIDLD